MDNHTDEDFNMKVSYCKLFFKCIYVRLKKDDYERLKNKYYDKFI